MTTADVTQALLGNYAEIRSSILPSGEVVRMTNVFAKNNTLMEILPTIAANNGDTHVGGIVTSLGGAYYNIIGAPKPVTTETTEVFHSDCAELIKTYAAKDEIIQHDPAGELLKKKDWAIEALSQMACVESYYGTGTTSTIAKRIKGLANIYNSLSGTNISANVKDMGHSGSDLTSIYFVTPSAEYGLTNVIPGKGSILDGYSGFKVQEPELQTIHNNAGATSIIPGATTYTVEKVWSGMITRHIGLFLADWRSCGRLANISVSALASSSTEGDVFKKIFEMSRQIKRTVKQNFGNIPTMAFCNSQLYTYLLSKYVALGAVASASNYSMNMLTYNDLPVLSIHGIMIMEDDNILYGTEARVA